MNVVKVGGSSLRRQDDIERLAQRLRMDHRPPTVVVTSALPTVTRRLEEAAYAAHKGNLSAAQAIVSALVEEHRQLANAMLSEQATIDALQLLFDEIHTALDRLLRGVAITRELTPRTFDRITSKGEHLALHLLHHILHERGLETATIPATELVVTDSTYGNAQPLVEHTATRVRDRLLPMLEQVGYVLTEGFVGTTLDGDVTTMGKESSSLTAALIAALIGARELVLYTPVAGIYTADPAIIPTAQLIAQLSYEHAEEVAHAGLKLLYPTMIAPLREHEITLTVAAVGSVDVHRTLITACESSSGAFVLMAEALAAIGLPHSIYREALQKGWHHQGISLERGARTVIAAAQHELAQLFEWGLSSNGKGIPALQLRVWMHTSETRTIEAALQRCAQLPSLEGLTLVRGEQSALITALILSQKWQVLPSLHEHLVQVCGYRYVPV
ncbi:MAG: hypothetical protein RML15_06590 [Bacteroidota bacterium]|nr:hypothetical protein [Candidatus Kapabacteria bacterium]MCS7303229.1 hypothetical protein [Candidatus Kapabacteria bacterium]MDW8075718.1 hypothetical protein [Bacteroidota bacterium]MDW8272060.1 hypothetical protein [Bacteroidota bacterium]